MAEHKEYWSTENGQGSIRISEGVIASIAARAVTETEGVSGLRFALTSHLVSVLNKKSLRVTLGDDDTVQIDVECLVRFGYNLRRVAAQVQHNICTAVGAMTGLQVDKVNVRIGGVTFAPPAEQAGTAKAAEGRKDAPSAPAAEEQAPSAPETASAAEEQTPSAPEMASAAEEQTPPAPETAPAAEEQAPSAPEAAPADEEQTPSAPETAPAAEEQAPVPAESLIFAEDGAAVSAMRASDLVEKLSIWAEELPVLREDASLFPAPKENEPKNGMA